MKKSILLLLFLFLFRLSFAQTEQGNWLFGGAATLRLQKLGLVDGEEDVKGILINVNPNAGYFLKDRLAAGVKLKLQYNNVTYRGVRSLDKAIGAGPFVRYYFFPVANRINLLGEGAYKFVRTYSTSEDKMRSGHVFSCGAGPAFFFNDAVALELTLNYETADPLYFLRPQNTLFVAVGFQFHVFRQPN